jgi:hypothetical protein
MNEFVITSDGVTLRFHSRRFDETGWLAEYAVSGEARNFRASLTVENQPFGSSPAAFFADIASNWRGWDGEKAWRAAEGEYRLSATTDSTGHITVTVFLDRFAVPPTWNAVFSVLLEAEGVDGLAARASEFFAAEENLGAGPKE